MSLDIEQLKRDDWMCEHLWYGKRERGKVLSMPGASDLFKVETDGGFVRHVEPSHIFNLPPKPKEPTRVAVWVQNNGGDANTWGNSFDTQTDFRAQPFGYIRIELPWPWTPAHQRWMDAFGTEGIGAMVRDEPAFKLWTLIEEGWTFIPERTSAGYCFGNPHFQGSERTLTAAVEAAWTMRRAAAGK